jgi:hypothetical protein
MSSFLDNLFTSGTASALATPTGAIDVSSTTPVLDYVLKVLSTSPMRAGWRPEAAGAGAPLYTTHIVTADTLSPVVDNAYLIYSPCTVTLPDATDPANQGKTIALMFVSGPNQVNTLSLEDPNYLVEFNSAVTGFSFEGGGLLLECVYQPADIPSGFWVVQRYQPKGANPLPDVSISQIDSVYTAAELPAPFDSNVIDGATVISANGSTVGTLQRDHLGFYTVGTYVLMPFLSDVPGLYQVIRDNSTTDWAFKFIEPATDPHGNPSYNVLRGETWGGRRVVVRQGENPLYVFERAALDFYPHNGDILASGTNTGLVHSNTTQLLPGRVNLVQTSPSFHDFVLAAPDANQERIFGERFGVKCVLFAAGVTFTIDVTPAQIESPDGLVGDSAVFTLQQGTYAEWQLMADNVWHLVVWLAGNAGG